MSAADSDTEVSAVEEVQGVPPTEPIVVPAALTLEELQRQIAELTVRHTKDVADLSNRNKDLELELLRERDSRREAETQLLKKQFAESSKGKAGSSLHFDQPPPPTPPSFHSFYWQTLAIGGIMDISE